MRMRIALAGGVIVAAAVLRIDRFFGGKKRCSLEETERERTR
jgi:hypothetical protein